MTFVSYPGHLIAALLLITFVALTALAFHSKEVRKANRWRWLLSSLQYASIVILLLILWNPSRPRITKTVARNSVLALFDTSQSMSISEHGGTSRLDRAIEVFEEKFHPGDTEGPNYKIHGFDHRPYHCSSRDSFHRWGQQTNMHGVLAFLDKYQIREAASKLIKKNIGYPGEPSSKETIDKGTVVGAVVFTDGQADDKNVNAYLPTQNENFQIVFAGVGSKKPYPDVAIRTINVPSRVAIETVYNAEVIITARNLQNKTVTIELLKDDQVIDSKQLSPGADAQEIKTNFVLSADRLGRHVLSARAKTVLQELNLANNIRNTIVQVAENEKLKVLLYSQVANFDIGKIRQSLARDSKIDLDLGLDAVKEPALSEKIRMMCGHIKLPNSRAEFYKYDLIILGPCELDKLSDTQIEGLYSFVVDRGGGLVLLPGRAQYGPAGWNNEKIKVLMPVFFASHDETTPPQISGEINLTPEGIDSRIISRADLEDCDEPTSAYYRNIDKKPAATTLACVYETPIVCVHRVGRGRVCLLNTANLFRWYRKDVEGGLLEKLMSGLTSYVGRVTNIEAGVELFVGRVSDQTNMVRFDAYVCDKAFVPVAGATVLLSVGDEVFHMDHAGQGYYATEIENITEGTIIATVQAEKDGEFLGEKTITANLPPPRSEMDSVQLDDKFLKALARRLNAKYFDADNIDENVTELFASSKRTGSVVRMESAWPTWPLLLMLCLILGFNWFARRAIGLV